MNSGLLDATGQLFLPSMTMQMENRLVNTQKCVLQSVEFVTTDYLSLDNYMFFWSVESVTNCIKTKWKNDKNLSEKYLTYKLVILMVLTPTSRASAMRCLDVRYLVKSEDAYIFTSHKLHKSWRKAKHHQNYTFISTQKIKNCVWCLS